MVRKFRLINLGCSGCAAEMEGRLLAAPGVASASIDFDAKTLRIDADEMELSAIAGIIRGVEPGVKVESADAPRTQGHDYNHDHDHSHGNGDDHFRREAASLAVAGVLYAVGLVFGDTIASSFGAYGRYAELTIIMAAYGIAGYRVLLSAGRALFNGNIFNEFFLMSFASLAAIAIGKPIEAASVMLFYGVGELMQEKAASNSRGHIRALIAQKPTVARVLRDGVAVDTNPENVVAGDVVAVKPGEKIPIDGIVVSGTSRVDTSSLTGESVPVAVEPSAKVFGGSVNIEGYITVEAQGGYEDSSVARILEMVENAVARKSPTERFITTFARYYTPAVVGIAALVAVIPPLAGLGAWSDWFYRALVLLVISCPCALVISIPLGYFGGIGAASRKGILVKGGGVFDALKNIHTIFFDKTGTLTRGVFKVTEVNPAAGVSRDELIRSAVRAESASNHPVARSIVTEFGEPSFGGDAIARELAGRGMVAEVADESGEYLISAGNAVLMKENGVAGVTDPESFGTVVHVARDKTYLGSIIVSDVIRDNARDAINRLRADGIGKVFMLTGDREENAAYVAKTVGVDGYRASLMPDGKVVAMKELASDGAGSAFVGDGVNDAPALASCGVGIAMGGLGSEVAVEVADAVILDDSPAKVAQLFETARATRAIIWQNIVFAMAIKTVFIGLGAFGIAGLWEAIFADVGVAVLAVLNAGRAMRA